MDVTHILSSFAALVFVLCLIGIVAVIFRKYGNGLGIATTKPVKRRLYIKEVLAIDAKKKVVLIARDDKEHLIAFSENSIEVIEKDVGNSK